MPIMVERNKWILYKHTSNYELIKAVALDVIDITASHYAYLGDGDKSIFEVNSLLAQTYESEVNLVVGVAFLLLFGSSGSRNGTWKDERRCSQRSAAQEIKT